MRTERQIEFPGLIQTGWLRGADGASYFPRQKKQVVEAVLTGPPQSFMSYARKQVIAVQQHEGSNPSSSTIYGAILVSTGAIVIALLRASMGTLLIYLKPKCEKHESALRIGVICRDGMGQ